MKSNRIISALLCLMLIVGMMAGAAALAEPTRKATVMIYMCGADLESKNRQGTSTMNEINRASGINTDQVNAVALLGGSASWALGYDSSKLTLVQLGGRRTEVIEELPQSYMSDPATLTAFLERCYADYPADEYYLVIWNHGGGPNLGMCHDFWSNETLSTQGLADALAASPFAERKLNGILFNACLMDSMEIAALVAPYADYMVATEESMYGMNYSWLGTLDTATPYDALVKLVDDTFTFNGEVYDRQGDDVINTVSLIDLGKMDAVVAAMDAFFTGLAPKVDDVNFTAMSGQRRDSAAFGMGESGGNSCYDLVDLGSLVTNLSDYAPAEAEALLSAVREAVPYVRTSDEGCYGMTVYHPFYNKDHAPAWMTTHNTLAVSGGFDGYLQRFSSILTGTPLADWTGLETGMPADKDARVLFNLDLTDDQAANYGDSSLDVLYYDAENESYLFTYTTDETVFEDGRLTSSYAGTTLYAVDGEGSAVSPVIRYQLTPGGEYQIPATLSRAATDETEAFEVQALISCRRDGEDKQLVPGGVLVYDPAAEGYTGIYNLSFSDFDTISIPVIARVPSYVDEEKQILKPFDQWDAVSQETWTADIDGSWSFRLLNDVFPTEDLYATFQVTDSQNNIYSSSPLRVKPGTDLDVLYVEYDDMGFLLINQATLAPVAGTQTLSLSLTNINEAESIYRLGNATIDGTAVDLSAECFGAGDNWGLVKDETQYLALSIPAEALGGAETFTEMTFDLIVTDAATETELGVVPVKVTKMTASAE